MAPVSFVGVASSWARPIGVFRGGTLSPQLAFYLGAGLPGVCPLPLVKNGILGVGKANLGKS